MPACSPLNCAPRRMLPPPMTKPIWQPLSAACLTWRAICVTSSMPMPRSPAWLKLSPDNFRMTRVKGGMKHRLQIANLKLQIRNLQSETYDLRLPQLPVDELFDLHACPLG